MSRILQSLFCLNRRSPTGGEEKTSENESSTNFGTATLSHLGLSELPDYILSYTSLSSLDLSNNSKVCICQSIWCSSL
jgi:hypothetical protein